MKYNLLLFFFFVSLSSLTSAHSKIIFIPGAHFNGSSFKELAMKFPHSQAVDFPLPMDAESIKKLSLSDYAKRVCDMANASVEDVILVGHSQGGAVMNQSLGLCPRKVRALVYIAAVIPMPEELPFALLEARDDEYYFRAIQENNDLGLFKVSDIDLFIDAFSQDSTISQRHNIKALVRDEPIGVSKEKVVFDRVIFDSLPKLVVTTKNDRIITSKTQKMYYARIQASEVYVLDSGHLPMITRVNALQRVISSFVQRLK
jgi:pimeloyl-ACP methyl ester carboxylesterase